MTGNIHRPRLMWINLIACAVLGLSGCAGNVRLIENGKVYTGRYEALGKTLDVTIDGVFYKGSYVTDSSASFGGFWSGTRYVTTSGTTSGSTGRAMLLSADNRVLRCEFMFQGMNAQGSCQDSMGRTFDMIASQ